MKSVAALLLVQLCAVAGGQTSAILKPYVSCTFDDGLALTVSAPLPAGAKGRTVDTTHGDVQVSIARSERLEFAYPGTETFVKVQVEQLPAASFKQGKADLISGFNKILASDDSAQRNYALKPTMSGLEVTGLDKAQLEGSTLGIYLMVDNATHVVTSLFFQNQTPTSRKFSTMEEYAGLRDHFLETYSACVHRPSQIPAASETAGASRGVEKPRAATVASAKPVAKGAKPVVNAKAGVKTKAAAKSKPAAHKAAKKAKPTKKKK